MVLPYEIRGCFSLIVSPVQFFRSREEDLAGSKEEPVVKCLRQLWSDERGQDVAEYAVMLAVILVIVVGTIRLIGGNANNVFSSVASSIGQ